MGGAHSRVRACIALVVGVAAAVAVAPSSAGAPAAPTTQSGGGVAENFSVLGHVVLGGKPADGDLWFHDHGGDVGAHVYVGTWRVPCTGRGVKIVDVSDATTASVVAVARLRRDGVDYEDVVVRKIGGRDILAAGVQACAGGRGGLALFDVTNPAQPKRLSFLKTGGHGVHELDVVRRRDGRALALLTVPFSDGYSRAGDLHVVDVSRPREPERVTTWGLISGSDMELVRRQRPVTMPLQGLGYYAAHYGHSVRGADDGTTAYVSYWDGGVVKLDISDPGKPRLLGRTGFSVADEGDAHSMTLYESGGERYIVQNDEDLDPRGVSTVTSSAAGDRAFHAIDLGLRDTLARTGAKTGSLVDAGDGCQAGDFSGAAGQIVLFDVRWDGRDACRIDLKIRNAVAAFASAVVVNLMATVDPQAFVQPSRDTVRLAAERAPGMAALVVAAKDGYADQIRAARERGEPVTVTLTPEQPSWGYVRIYKESLTSDPESDSIPNFAQVGAFDDLPYVVGTERSAPGVWSVHNTEVLGNRAYSSWYSNGVAAIDLTDPAAPRRVGWFVPPPTTRRARGAREFGRGDFALVWGVAIDPSTGIVYASDMRSGLWILQPTGEAAPSF